MSLRDLWTAWNSFWFASGSPVPVALFRIATGFLVLVFYWWISPEAMTFFGAHPIVLPATVERWMSSPELDVLSFLPHDDFWLRGALVLLVISGICLICGIFSRLNAFVVYLIMLSLDSRNHFVLNTGIKIMIVMTLFLVFSRCGEALSFKRLARIWRKKDPEFGPAKDGSVFGQRLMQVQMALVYWSAASCKLHGISWIDGTAVYYAVHLTQFQRFSAPYLLDHLWVCRLLSWGTVVFELSFPFLIWIKELRYPLLLVGVLFHFGLDWAMVIPLFQLVMMAGYIPYVEAKDWSFLMNAIKRLASKIVTKKLLVVYDAKSGYNIRLAETIRRLDVFGLLNVVESNDQEPEVKDVSVQNDFRQIALRLPLLWALVPIILIPGFDRLVAKAAQRLTAIYK